jgi:hypothetical protein
LLFRWVFTAAAAFLTISFVALLAIEEIPLRGPVSQPTSPQPSAPVAAE